jgi:hypothetical protein
VTAITRPQVRCVGPLRTIPHLFKFPTVSKFIQGTFFRARSVGYCRSPRGKTHGEDESKTYTKR